MRLKVSLFSFIFLITVLPTTTSYASRISNREDVSKEYSLYENLNKHGFLEQVIQAHTDNSPTIHGSGSSKSISLQRKFSNVLNIKNIPASSSDRSRLLFSDKGAWFGFALPPDSCKTIYNGFIGPFLFTENRWLSKSIAELVLTNVDTKEQIKLQNCDSVQFNYYPGLLTQELFYKDFKLIQNLFITTSKTAIQKLSIVNTSALKLSLTIGWKSKLLLEKAKITNNGEEVIIEFGKNNLNICLFFDPTSGFKNSIKTSDVEYEVSSDKVIEINPSREFNTSFVLELKDGIENKVEHINTVHEMLKNSDKYLSKNEKRWKEYIQRALSSKKSIFTGKEYDNLTVKALETLITNWRSPFKDLRHDGLFPSVSVGYFNGFWSWDSWKHAVALAEFEPELAKNQVRTMFDYQSSDGMVPDVIYADSTENNWLDTKPPLASWAVDRIYSITKEKDFLKEMYPKLIQYHYWWYRNRDHDLNGLCEYGATVDSLIAAKWESGMDNAIRFDERKMLKNSDKAFSMNVESVDLNSYLYREKKTLASFAATLSLSKDKEKFNKEARLLKKNIQEKMFDAVTGFFYDIDLETKNFVKVQGPEGWIPLWSGAANSIQAKCVREIVLNPTKFNSFIPFPTVAVDNTKIDLNGYWRGPVWLDQAYFGIAGLENYGYPKDALMLTKKLMHNLEGLLFTNAPIRENYNPLTGEGLEANNFSWSAAHILLLLWSK